MHTIFFHKISCAKDFLITSKQCQSTVTLIIAEEYRCININELWVFIDHKDQLQRSKHKYLFSIHLRMSGCWTTYK